MAKQTSHSSLTPSAKKVSKLLKSNGYSPYPGIINGTFGNGGNVRIIVRQETNRVVLVISSAGVQEVYLYGRIDTGALLSVLSTEFDNVTVRDHK